jgi:peptidoglycan hydrolase-like protein with peptidoglycan-binding domain
MLARPGPIVAVEALALLGCLLGALTAGPAVAASAGKASPAAAASAKDAEVPDAPDLDDASYQDLVTDAQRLLRLRGFDPGPLDGQIGVRTRQAIRAYQAEARARGVLEASKPPPAEAEGVQPAAGPQPEPAAPAATAGSN